jgi:hypothetical protein
MNPKHRNEPNKPKKYCLSFSKQTENQPKQVEFRFVSVWTEIFFCLFRGHPTYEKDYLLLKKQIDWRIPGYDERVIWKIVRMVVFSRTFKLLS